MLGETERPLLSAAHRTGWVMVCDHEDALVHIKSVHLGSSSLSFFPFGRIQTGAVVSNRSTLHHGWGLVGEALELQICPKLGFAKLTVPITIH
jgi:hypothetical protein